MSVMEDEESLIKLTRRWMTRADDALLSSAPLSPLLPAAIAPQRGWQQPWGKPQPGGCIATQAVMQYALRSG